MHSLHGVHAPAGGAWQSSLEKHPLPEPDGTLGPAAMYTMMINVPLEGPLAEGGLIFVLKSGSTGQNTKWLKVSVVCSRNISCSC
jgi:hypothetical protein